MKEHSGRGWLGIRGRLIGAHLAVVLVFMSILALIVTHWLQAYYVDSMQSILTSHGEVFAGFFERYLANEADLASVAQPLAVEMGQEVDARVQVIGPQGRVLADSLGVDRGARLITPVIRAALHGQVAAAVSRWPGQGQVLEVAVPIQVGRVIGTVRLTSSLREVARTMTTVWQLLGVGTVVAGVVAVAVGWLLARTVTEPLRDVAAAAAEMARGNLGVQAVKRREDEIGALADTLNRMAGELLQMERIRAEFLGGVSHELKTPLTAIKGYVVTLLDSPLLGQRERAYLEIVDRETDRLARLVEDLLELGRAQAGRLHLSLSPTVLDELVESTVAQMQGRAARQGVVLAAEGPPGVVIQADRDRLRQVLLNLLDNAIKFSDPGQRVRVRWWEEGEELLLEVTDEGIGILPEDQPHVFERFYRGSARGRPGTGLGLAVVREIVVAHGGRVDLHSEVGKGTRVLVRLPRQGHPSGLEPLSQA